MYDPSVGRFMQQDSYKGETNDPLSLNIYTYCKNDPLIYDDPNGHWAEFIDNIFEYIGEKVNVLGNWFQSSTDYWSLYIPIIGCWVKS